MFDFKMPPLTWRRVTIKKDSGGFRHLCVPNEELMKVQKLILQYLYKLLKEKKLSVSYFAHGFMPNKNTSTSILKHSLDSDVFLCCDMKDFFDNFPVLPVKVGLLNAGIDNNLVNKILTACTYEGHFPQGSPTSPFLTNIGMFEVDKALYKFAKKHKFKYTRYADDILFSLLPGQPIPSRPEINDDLKHKSIKNYHSIFYGIESIIYKEVGISLNHKKDHVIYRGSKCKPLILGIILRQDKKGYNANKKLRLQTRAAVFNLARKIKGKRGKVYEEDRQKWRSILGTIQYMDYIRSLSEDGFNGADPVIQEKYFNYIEERMNKGGK